jgi:hypothetical protein
MNNEQQQDNLDAYIRNEMTTEQRSSFELELSQNDELQEDLSFLKDTDSALKLHQRAALKKKLRSLEAEDKNQATPFSFLIMKPYAIAASILLVLGAVGFWVTRGTGESTTTTQVATTQTPDSTGVAKIHAIEENNQPEKAKNNQQIIPDKKNGIASTSEIPEVKNSNNPIQLPIKKLGTESLGLAGKSTDSVSLSCVLSKIDTMRYTFNENVLNIYHFENLKDFEFFEITTSAFSGNYLKYKGNFYRIIATKEKQKLMLEKSKSRLKMLAE